MQTAINCGCLAAIGMAILFIAVLAAMVEEVIDTIKRNIRGDHDDPRT